VEEEEGAGALGSKGRVGGVEGSKEEGRGRGAGTKPRGKGEEEESDHAWASDFR